MTNVLKPLIAAALFATALTPLAAVAANDGAMTMRNVPCSQAAGMMHGAAMHGDAMKGDAMKGDAMHGDAMKGDAMHGDAMKSASNESVDKAYATAAAANARSLVEMANLEMRCGSDPKVKASAEGALPNLQQLLTTLQIF